MQKQPHKGQIQNDPFRDQTDSYPTQSEVHHLLKFLTGMGNSVHALQLALQNNYAYEPSQATARVRKFICTGE